MNGSKRALWRVKDVSVSALVAGLLSVLVSLSGPVLIYLNAAEVMSVDTNVFASWVFAIMAAAGVSSIALSLWFKVPISMAWSAPGTVLLISMGTSLTMAEIVGGYLVVALGLCLVGLSGVFQKLVNIIPESVIGGLMAGILFGFLLKAAAGFEQSPILLTVLFLSFVVFSVAIARFAMLALLALSLVLTLVLFDSSFAQIDLTLAAPVFVSPSFSWGATLSFALPLFIITLSGQYLPGISILRANGYQISANPILLAGGLASVFGAFFGGVTTSLAAITAAFCAGPDAHEDPSRRYMAGVFCGLFMCLCAAFSGSIVDLLNRLPGGIISALAGAALLAPTMGFARTMLGSKEPTAGILTFVVTTSGVSIFGIGAAFWGVVIGTAAYVLARVTQRLMDLRHSDTQ